MAVAAAAMRSRRPALATLLALALALAAAPARAAEAEVETEASVVEPTWIDFAYAKGGPSGAEHRFAQAAAATADESTGCVDLPFAMCVGSQAKGDVTAFTADAVERALVGRWDFDDQMAQDTSGHMNHAVPAPLVGPGLGGQGQSARFNGTWGVRIPHQPVYSSPALTISFWFFLVKNAFGAPRTLLHKGNKDHVAPSILFNPEGRKLQVAVSTTEGVVQFESNAAVLARRWVHVAYVQDGRVITLYINGIRDVDHLIAPPHVIANREPIFLGKDPNHNGLHCYLDGLKIYNRALNGEDLLPVASEAFNGCGTSDIQFGCSECSLAVARERCKHPRRLCSPNELSTCGLLVGSTMGWLSLDRTVVWSSESTESDGKGHRTVALCCGGSEH